MVKMTILEDLGSQGCMRIANSGFIFEQEYQRQKDRTPVNEVARDLDRFFKMVPNDTRYHLELRQIYI
jgi:hypothetical protein